MRTFFLSIIILMATANLNAQQPPLIDRENFFGDPEIRSAQISPDGQWLSFIKNYDSIPNIWVKKIDEPFEKGRPLTNHKRPISRYFWSRDGKYLLFMQDKGGNENYNIYAVDPAQKADSETGVPESRNLTPMDNVIAYIMNAPYNDPNILYVGINNRDASWHDLYKLQITTGQLTLISENKDRLSGWYFDWNDKLRLASRSNKDGSGEILEYQPDGTYKVIYSVPLFESAAPAGFTPDNKKVYITTNKGERDLSELILMDLATRKTTLVERDPENKVDFGSLAISDKTRKPIVTTYTDDKTRYYWKDKSYEAYYNFLKKKFPGKEISIGSSNEDETLFIISVYSDSDPGESYLFDTQTKELKFQYRPRPKDKLNPEELSSMEAIRYPSSDGLVIPAYLTLPKGLPAKNLPLIVNPHGGPWARDHWGFNTYSQFFANRGYAVLQINFRGSTGYGKKFLNAGNKEWGKKMQDDITWGVKHLIEKGIADPKRVGIFGGSYGGYATLAGLTFTPDVYAAGVDFVGPSNLITLLKSIPPYWESGRKEFTERMGDYETKEGEDFLKSISPLFHVDSIKAPLMVVQGANDPRVKKPESDQIVMAMRDKQLPVEYLLAMDEGHGFRKSVNNMAFIAAMEKFFAQHIGGRYEEHMRPEIAEKLKEISVDITTLKEAEVAPEASLQPIVINGSLKEKTVVYSTAIDAQGQKINFDITVQTVRDGDNWTITESATTSFGAMKTSSLLSGKDYSLLSKNIEQGQAKIAYMIDGEKLSGKVDAMGNNIPLNLTTGGISTFAAEEGVGQALTLLPMTEGYAAQFSSMDAQSMQMKKSVIKIEGEEKITVPKGVFTCRKLTITNIENPSSVSQVWIDAATQTVVKMTTSSGMMKYVFELK